MFVAYDIIAGARTETRDITVTRQQVEQLAAGFARTWQRQPSEGEMKSLIDDHVKEEVYVREALRLGLDKDDTVIRRRLRQKMEFMEQAESADLTPAPGELEAFFDANKADFKVEPKLAFEQVFIDPRKHGENANSAAQDVLNALRANASVGEMGDASMLPPAVELSRASAIAAIFGPGFAEQAVALPQGVWSGPVASEYGLHLVRITQREDGALPPLDDVRDAVILRWREAKQAELSQQRFQQLLKSYEVKIELTKGGDQP